MPAATTPPVTTPPVTTPPVTTPTVAKYTQADVKNVALLGALTQVITATEVGSLLGFVSGLVQGTAEVTGGSTVLTAVACKVGGSFNFTTTKATERTGLAVGDQLAVSFVNCDVGDDLVLNGALTAVTKSDTANLPASDYRVAFDLSATSFVMTFRGSPSTFDGTISGEHIVAAKNSFTAAFTVPAGPSFTAVVGDATSALTYSYAEGTTFKSVDVISPNSASRQLDGQVSVKTATTSATPLTISTPAALAGTLTSGRFIATTGSTYTKATNMNLATSVSVSGTTTTVSGDTDSNNTMDLVFTTTWEGLVF